MNRLFNTVYSKLESQRITLLQKLAEVTPEKLLTASPGKWSIAQILTHILTSERLSLGYIKKKSLGIEALKDSGVTQVLLINLLTLSQRIPFRYRAPKVIVQHTPEALSLSELTAQWEQVRAELKGLLESIEDHHARRLVFKHPVGGRLDAAQAVKFMYEHINHHLPQINRLLK